MTERQDGTAPAVQRFCVTHEQPVIPHTWYDDTIAIGRYRPESGYHISQLDPFWHAARPIAYGTAGSFGVPAALSRHPSTAPLIEISNHRKRVLPSPEGIAIATVGGWRELDKEQAERRTDLIAFTPGNGFLIGWPMYFPETIAGHYSRHHHFRDLLDYASLAIESGVLDDHGAAEMMGAKLLIPGGAELGVFPRSWLLPALSGIEKVSREFLVRYGDRVRGYDDYQVRAVGFLAERLGSYLLLRDILAQFEPGTRVADLEQNLPVPLDVLGHLTVISEKDKKYEPARADADEIT